MESIEPLKLVAAVVALAIAIIGHEIMHGWVAKAYGDMTAKNAGRLTINPLNHVDLVGTILVPSMLYFLPKLFGEDGGFLFGWAKPVPINITTVMRNGGYNGVMQVDLAGIVYNFTIAAFAAVAITNMAQPTINDGILYIFIYLLAIQLLIVNVFLGVFNALPIPSFDGANFIANLAMKYKIDSVAHFLYRYAQYGFFIALIILMTPLKDYLLLLPVQIILNLLVS